MFPFCKITVWNELFFLEKTKKPQAMNKDYLRHSALYYFTFTLITPGLKWGIIDDGERGLYDQLLIIEKRSTWMHEYEKIKVFMLPWSLLGKETPPIKVYFQPLTQCSKKTKKDHEIYASMTVGVWITLFW